MDQIAAEADVSKATDVQAILADSLTFEQLLNLYYFGIFRKERLQTRKK